MKKHPIDDLFKHKLSEWEKKPSFSAWEKIQKENKKKQKGIVWPWYAAASVMMTLMAGYGIWKYNSNTTINDGNKERMALNRKEMPVPSVTKPNEVDSAAYQVAVSEKRSEIKAINKQSKKVQQKLPVSSELSKPDESIVAVKEPEPAIADLNVTLEKISVDVKPEIKSLTVETIASSLKPAENEPSRTIVVAVETQNNEEDRPKGSKLSRVFRQLKNARAGEQVDWEEVGFNPKSLVAKVDDRLRNGEEKVSEKYHNLKERTKL